MNKKKQNDIAVFVGLVLTLTLCIISFVLQDELNHFEIKKYSDITTGTIVIHDLMFPGESELYYEYKEKLEIRINQVKISFGLCLLSLIFTVMSALHGLVTRSGLDMNVHE